MPQGVYQKGETFPLNTTSFGGGAGEARGQVSTGGPESLPAEDGLCKRGTARGSEGGLDGWW